MAVEVYCKQVFIILLYINDVVCAVPLCNDEMNDRVYVLVGRGLMTNCHHSMPLSIYGLSRLTCSTKHTI